MLDTTSPDPIGLHARLRPNSVAARNLADDRRWTYAELDMDIRRAVTVLQEFGLGHGDRVAVLAGNSVLILILQHALMRMGAILVPLNWRLTPAELAGLAADCTPVLLISDRDPPKMSDDCKVVRIRDIESAVAAAVPAPPKSPHASSDTCLILYTSGTSGTPKGAMLTSRALLSTAFNFAILADVDSRSAFLCDSPMFHVIGIVTQLWTPLTVGGAVLISDGFNSERTNDRIADPDLGVTHYFCVPQMAEALRHAANFAPAKWSSLRALLTGGAPNPPSHIREWLGLGVRMVDGYGMTEAGTILGMSLDPELISAKAGSVGLPGPLTEVRLVDETGAGVAPDTPGEIQVRGPNVITAYWNRPEEREKTFLDGDWMRTGDIGRRDADGFVTIVDRSKDMFISGGENVYPVEVEAALVEHPLVREVAVIGMPDEKWGEVGCAFIIPAPQGVPSSDDLARHCGERIARYKIPKQFLMMDALPRTGSGKVQKHLLADKISGR